MQTKMNASLVRVCVTTPRPIFFFSVSPYEILICGQQHLPHVLGSALGTSYVWSHFTFKLSFGETGLSQSGLVTQPCLLPIQAPDCLTQLRALDMQSLCLLFQVLMDKSNTGEVGQNEIKLSFFKAVMREGKGAAFYAATEVPTAPSPRFSRLPTAPRVTSD